MLDLPPSVMARVFAIMTFTAVTGSIIFNFTTNGNGELLSIRARSISFLALSFLPSERDVHAVAAAKPAE